MSWRDDLLPASFRGVPFHYEDTKREGGRRGPDHEFPDRDDAYPEDLGRKKKQHSITGYVIGDDYMESRAALEDALDAKGPATLVHPYRGALNVQVRTWTSQEVRGEGRMARFDFMCVEAGAPPAPLASSDTSGEAVDAGDDVSEQLEVSFVDDWDVGEGDTLGFASDLLDELGDALDALVTWPGIDTALAASSLVGLVVTDAAALAGAVTGFFSLYADAVLEAVPDDDPSFSSRGLNPVADPSHGLSTLAAWGDTLATPAGQANGANQDTLTALVEGSATVALAKVYAQTAFVAQADADAARSQVAGLVDRQSLAASAVGDDAADLAWQGLYRAAAIDLTIRAKQVPTLLVLSLGGAMPALVLAQRLYRDPGRAPELVARNAAPHPLFMPTEIQALAS